MLKNSSVSSFACLFYFPCLFYPYLPLKFDYFLRGLFYFFFSWMSDLRWFLSFCHPRSLTNVLTLLANTPFKVLEEDYLLVFSTGELIGREFEESVDCHHLCRNSTGELAGWAALHFSPFAGSCYCHVIFCVSEPLVIGDREAEIPNQLILSL